MGLALEGLSHKERVEEAIYFIETKIPLLLEEKSLISTIALFAEVSYPTAKKYYQMYNELK